VTCFSVQPHSSFWASNVWLEMGKRVAMDREFRFLSVEMVRAFGSMGVTMVRESKFVAFVEKKSCISTLLKTKK